MPSAITRRQLLLSTSAMGLGLLAGCGRLPWQASEPPPRVHRVGFLSLYTTPAGHIGVTFLASSGDSGSSGGPNGSTGTSAQASSPNVVAACEVARARGMQIVGLLGRDGGRVAALCDLALVVHSPDTQRIQETHNLVGHILCELVEQLLCAAETAEHKSSAE